MNDVSESLLLCQYESELAFTFLLLTLECGLLEEWWEIFHTVFRVGGPKKHRSFICKRYLKSMFL